jgi:hypothetical protein
MSAVQSADTLALHLELLSVRTGFVVLSEVPASRTWSAILSEKRGTKGPFHGDVEKVAGEGAEKVRAKVTANE